MTLKSVPYLLLGCWALMGHGLASWAEPAPDSSVQLGYERRDTFKARATDLTSAGMQLLAIDSYEQAIAWETSAQLTPSAWDADIAFNLGLLYQDRQLYPQAQKAFERVLQRDPQHFKSRYHLALCALRQNHPEVAKAYWQELLIMARGNTDMEAHLQGLILDTTLRTRQTP